LDGGFGHTEILRRPLYKDFLPRRPRRNTTENLCVLCPAVRFRGIVVRFFSLPARPD
jgi:hypothetical protein